MIRAKPVQSTATATVLKGILSFDRVDIVILGEMPTFPEVAASATMPEFPRKEPYRLNRSVGLVLGSVGRLVSLTLLNIRNEPDVEDGAKRRSRRKFFWTTSVWESVFLLIRAQPVDLAIGIRKSGESRVIELGEALHGQS